jgi:hypothetical protein
MADLQIVREWDPVLGRWLTRAVHEGRAQHGGVATTIANDGAYVALPWGARNGGTTDLLDLTVTTAPTILTAGTYAFSVRVGPTAPLTAGGSYAFDLQVDADGEDPQLGFVLPSPAAQPPLATLAMTYYSPAGGKVIVSAANFDGAVSRDFILAAVVQRLS